MAWLDRLKAGLQRTRSGLANSLEQALGGRRRITPAEAEEIEELLIAGDVGARLAADLVAGLSEDAGAARGSGDDLLAVLRASIVERLAGSERRLGPRTDGEPTVFLVAGVNGAGKTTTIAKLAAHLRRDDPLLPITFAAADTFRAAAVEQLAAWADRIGAGIVRQQHGADPSAVVFDALDRAAKTGGVLFVDTAGRLQTKHNLMEELRKIERTVEKKLQRPSDERLLVLDATTGQNGISQAQRFHEAIGLTGIVLTKLDSTAKGGVVLAIWEALRVPICYVGVGESADDLHAFAAAEFVDALFGD